MRELIYSVNDWAYSNPVLGERVMGVELGTSKFKMGDGVTAWNDLPYYTPDPNDITIHVEDISEGWINKHNPDTVSPIIITSSTQGATTNIVGTAHALGKVYLRSEDGETIYATVDVDAQGDFTIDIDPALEDGLYEIIGDNDVGTFSCGKIWTTIVNGVISTESTF